MFSYKISLLILITESVLVHFCVKFYVHCFSCTPFCLLWYLQVKVALQAFLKLSSMKHSEDFIQEFTSRLTVATMNSKDNNVQSQAYEDSYIH